MAYPTHLQNLTDGQQYDKIDDAKINELFLALEEIRQKFQGSISGTSAFNTDIAKENVGITNNYINQIKTDIQHIEQSKYVPANYSNQITVPNVNTLIEAGKYYNGYISLFKQIYDNCVHDGHCGGNMGNCGWYGYGQCGSIFGCGSNGGTCNSYGSTCSSNSK